MGKIKNYFIDYFKTLKSIHPAILIIFVLTIITMNILANFTIYQGTYLAIDGGIIVTWLVASICDIVTITKGPRTTIRMSIFGIVISLLVSGIFAIINAIFRQNMDISQISPIFSGTWFIVISSVIAFGVSTSVNALLNYSIGLCFKNKRQNKITYCVRCYPSTLISQFLDNFIFSSLAYMVFAPLFWNGFAWSILQTLSCAATYAGIALLVEIIVTPVTYKIVKKIEPSE
mgnify:CR=1 FL=1